MRIDVLTLFPEMFEGTLRVGLLGKAIEAGLIEIGVTNIRDFATDRHRTVDDAPFGGGPGMVMMCEPVFAAVESLRGRNSLERVALLTPRGRRFDQALAREWAQTADLALVCGRYEGFDERIHQALGAEEVSLGDFVLSGGELAALVIIEAVSRMIPGVVGDWESVITDSFYDGLLGAPQYTRPAEWRGMAVPAVLREGNHAAIERWRRKESLRLTRARRPDLLDSRILTREERELLQEIEKEARLEKENET